MNDNLADNSWTENLEHTFSSKDISVLMSVYRHDHSTHFRTAVESILNQSDRPHEIVLIVDGPIHSDLDREISDISKSAPVKFKVLKLEKNRGLAYALMVGTELCSGSLIARMDSDDISESNRFAKQLEYLNRFPGTDLVASWHEEFELAPYDSGILKKIPEDDAAIKSALNWRCVISHPTILIKRSSLVAAGGYRDQFEFMEDYDLYARMIVGGHVFGAVQQALVNVRGGMNQRTRRGGLKYAKTDVAFRIECYKRGIYGLGHLLVVSSATALFRIVPTRFRSWLYRFVRSSTNSTKA